MRSPARIPIAALALATGWFGAACPPPTVVVGGKAVPAPRAEEMILTQAREAARAGRSQEAIEKYERFVTEFPDSESADDALWDRAALLMKAGRVEDAVADSQRLIAQYPQSPYYLKAAVQMGLGLLQLGRTAEALPTLQSVFDQLPDAGRKREVAGMLARSYRQAGARVEALRWMARLVDLTPEGDARALLREQILELVDRELTFVQVREAIEVLSQAGIKTFPADVLHFKLAKIFYHIHDFERARQALETYAATWPDSAHTAEAGQLLKKIIDRSRVQPNVIGVLLPLSGKYREYGRKALAGLQLGAGIFDDAGQSGGAPVLVIRDTAGDADQAARQMESLVFEEHVICVIGPMFSGEAFTAAVKAQELQVPIITMSAKPGLPELGQYVFRNFLTLADQARLLVGYAMEALHAKRFALLYPNDKYGVGFVNAFWDEVLRRKGEVRAAERYEPDTKNFSTVIKKLVGRYWLKERWDFVKEKRKIEREIRSPLAQQRALEKLYKHLPPIVDFDVVFVPDYVDKVVLIAPALAFEDILLKTTSHWKIERYKKSLGRDKLDMVYLMGGNGWNNPNVVQWAERYVQGAIFTDGFFLGSTRPATRLFVGKYKANFDGEPDMISAQAYDSAMIARQIVERAKPADRAAFRRALLEMKDFDGATGKTRFLASGEAEKELFLLTVEKEEIVEIDRGPASDAS
ncbi:MAG: penicillin-binding protein activator [Deltaproteobacteria bacterium]|nr:penicillin-binding protein activator [Deltaproteobacteria bacterium]